MQAPGARGRPWTGHFTSGALDSSSRKWPPTEEASAEAGQATGPGGGPEKVSGDRTRSEGAGKPGAPAGVQPGPRRPAGCGGEAEADTCNISFVIKTGSGRRRARRIGTARRMKTRRSPRERDTVRGPGCPARPGLTVPERRPHGTRQREGGTGAGPAPGASEATSARVPRKGTHPALPPQPSSEGAHRVPPPKAARASWSHSCSLADGSEAVPFAPTRVDLGVGSAQTSAPMPTPGASSGCTAAPRHGPCMSSLLQLSPGRLGEGSGPRGLPRSHGHAHAHRHACLWTHTSSARTRTCQTASSLSASGMPG